MSRVITRIINVMCITSFLFFLFLHKYEVLEISPWVVVWVVIGNRPELIIVGRYYQSYTNVCIPYCQSSR
ncbi:hypothetical protein BDZ94DRAFT_1249476 [Collybia nuda]|uniref:Uncharacterized protein n=1 Tax=Collybia nuda TaxID=64659 RepID=A0A9P5YF24_9AGAR|nr:hypothetical protein BDZ94DRAFT_1249476 [Collybia nuda]